MQDGLWRALQRGRHGRVHRNAERAVVRTGVRTLVRSRNPGVRPCRSGDKIVRVADLHGAHDADEQEAEQGKETKPGGRVAAALLRKRRVAGRALEEGWHLEKDEVLSL